MLKSQVKNKWDAISNMIKQIHKPLDVPPVSVYATKQQKVEYYFSQQLSFELLKVYPIGYHGILEINWREKAADRAREVTRLAFAD